MILTGRMAAADRPTRPTRLISRPVETLMKAFVRLGCRMVVEGQELLPPAPFIVCTNHRSHVDSVVIMAALDVGFASCGLVAARDYFFGGWRRHLVVSSIFTLIPVERIATVGSFRRSVLACARFLRAGGQVIVIYPEGSRSQDALLQPFKRGPAALSLALGLPIVPGFIEGTERVMPKGGRFVTPSPVRLRVGAALYPAAYVDAATGAPRSREMTAALASAIAGLGRVAPWRP